MKLDPRIKSLPDILTCFDIEKAKQYIGEKGYFAGDLCCFKDVQLCAYGTLADVFNDTDDTFKKREGEFVYPFFIPEYFVKPNEKQYRPYTFMEFSDIFTVGRPIKFRRKGKVGHERYLILNGYEHELDGLHDDQTITYAYIGAIPYTFNELFKNYEWQEHYTEDFEPFGVEVEVEE